MSTKRKKIETSKRAEPSKRAETFGRCSIKNPALENLLANKIVVISAMARDNNISLSFFTGKRSSHVDSMKDDEIIVLNIQEKGANAHSNILVKNKFLTNGWSIFDPNGQKNLPYHITTNENRDIKITSKYVEVSPSDTINYGSSSINPGYCGIFGIIFMTYFKNNNTNPNWVKNWQHILRLMEKQHTPTSLGSYGVDLAAQIQHIINSNLEGSPKIEQLILEAIVEFTSKSPNGGKSINKYKNKYKYKTTRRDAKLVLKSNTRKNKMTILERIKKLLK